MFHNEARLGIDSASAFAMFLRSTYSISVLRATEHLRMECEGDDERQTWIEGIYGTIVSLWFLSLVTFDRIEMAWFPI